MSKKRGVTVYARNPVYVFYAVGAVLLFIFCSLLASRENIGNIEKAVFDVIYGLGDALRPIFWVITQMGSLPFAIFLSGVFLIFRRDIALRLFTASALAYILALTLKSWAERARPEFLLDYVVPRDVAEGLGFPSGHMAVATALGLTLALYAPRSMRKWIIGGMVLVGVSRVYLGVHLPLDIVGGYAVGLFCYSLVSLALGAVYYPINLKLLVAKLQQGGLTNLKLKPAAVDARGSVPFFGEYDGGKVFVKVFNQDNNAADWLFKITRRIQYRRLEDEVPSFTPKRAIEHEAYITMLAKNVSGVRVPDILGVFKVKPNNYAMATARVDAVGLDKIEDDKVTDKLLDKCWQQITRLHSAQIIHKDLRTANLLVSKDKQEPWLIDFGFSEGAIGPRDYHKDNVEFIASSATKVGAKRAVAAAKRALGKEELKDVIPYLQYAALSGATTTALKRNKSLMAQIRKELSEAAGVKERVKNARITRVSKSGLFQIGVIVLMAVLLAPQISSLKEGVEVMATADLYIYSSALVLSVLTYFWATLSYKTLAEVPLSTRKLFMVQWAGSFANRLLPVGAGSLSFNAMYMKKNGHNHGEAGTIAALNNILGLIASLILILLALILWSSEYNILEEIEISLGKVLIIAAIAAGGGLILYKLYTSVDKIRVKAQLWLNQSKAAFKTYSNKPFVIIGALLAQIMVTITYSAVMLVSAYAINVDISFSQALFAVTMGSLFGSLIPTPGGIGGTEAGIVAAFNVVGLPTEQGIAIALLYRLATFWLTIPPGYLAYRYTFAKSYFS